MIFKRVCCGCSFALISFFSLMGSAYSQDINGAGASFPAPAYMKWAGEYHRVTGIKINYQSIGSSGGVKQIDSRVVDFGATDAPLRDDELSRKSQIQFPTLVGGIVPIVNIKGINPGELRLSGRVIGDIYLGKITKWSDPAIAALNPGLGLPDAAIATVHRADGSGTSFLFSSFLSRTNPEWKEKVGEGTALNWPGGTGGKGNEGVAIFVSRLANSIGYVEYAYVKQSKLSYAQLENASGAFVSPSAAAFAAAAVNADWNKSFYQVLTNQPGKDAWPITGATYILMNTEQADSSKTRKILEFFRWAYTKGDKTAVDLDYVPMSNDVVALIEKQWGQLKDTQGVAILTN